MNDQSTSILYLAGGKFQVFVSGMPRIVDYTLGGRFVQDRDVVNKEDLQQDLKSFLSKENIQPGNMIMVISASANYAASPDNYNALKGIFENLGFKVEFIMPEYVYDIHELTIESAGVIFRDTFKFKSNNLLYAQIPAYIRPEVSTQNIASLPGESPEEKYFRKQRKSDVLRLYAYTSIFGMLIIALLVVWYVNPFGQSYRGKAIVEPTVTAMPTFFVPTVTATPATASATLRSTR